MTLENYSLEIEHRSKGRLVNKAGVKYALCPAKKINGSFSSCIQGGEPNLTHWFSACSSVKSQQNELSKVAKEPLDLCLQILRSEIFLSLSHFLSISAFLHFSSNPKTACA